MAGSADLVIKVMADVSSARTSFDSLGGSIGKALGIGAAAAGTGAVVKAAEDYQSALAKIQMADQSFQPGTSKYEQAKQTILGYTTSLATSFEDVAAVYAQAAKVTDASGSKLGIDKINELTDASIRLGKASQGSLDAVTALQDQSTLSKIFSETEFHATGNAIAALTQQHPQNEGTLLDAAIAIGQVGAPLGVTLQQSLGLGNYLSDLGAGGQMGGSSIGRTLQRMNTAADEALDPEAQYSNLKKHRDATEKLADLQNELAVAEQRRSQMFGQHGLKTEYKRDPAAMMEANQRIAKLQREINDQSQDISHMDEGGASRGAVDLKSMAATAGKDLGAFAQEFKDNPIQALLDFTRGVGNLPTQQREAALSKAGITNVRDLKTLSLLSDQPDSVQRMIDIANNPGDALNTVSNVALGTTASKQTDAANLARNAIVNNGGEQARQGLDALLDSALKLGKAMDDDSGKFGLFGNAMGGVVDILGPVLGYEVTKGVASKVLGGGGKNAATKVVETAASDSPALGAEILAGASTSLSAIGAVVAPVMAAALSGAAVKLGLDNPALVDYVAQGDSPYTDQNKTPTSINVQVNNQSMSLQDVLDAVTGQIRQAWDHAQSSQPVTGAIGGLPDLSGQGPR